MGNVHFTNALEKATSKIFEPITDNTTEMTETLNESISQINPKPNQIKAIEMNPADPKTSQIPNRR